MFKFLKEPQGKPQISSEEVDKTYNKLRWQVFIGIFIGYAGYYLIRKNFALAIWNGYFIFMLTASIISIGLIAMTIKTSKKEDQQN